MTGERQKTEEQVAADTDRRVEGLIRCLSLDQLAGFQPDRRILGQALRHSSYSVENPPADGQAPNLDSNQRLEFLGDAILGYLIALKSYEDQPDAAEGELTKARAALVCEKSLAAAARVMGLGNYLQMGRGIAAAGGASQASVLADAFEALLGALLLCGVTLPALEAFVSDALAASRHLLDNDAEEDYKGKLQALVQKTNSFKLFYDILDEKGPDHRKIFLAAARLNDREIGRGWGNTKQEAQKQAAKLALWRLTTENDQGAAVPAGGGADNGAVGGGRVVASAGAAGD
ncbi:MAG: ribonuclease III, partial [Peptococcaceae bacterium]|nr:ribonuclease III [Peptococcaceae bacterium]